MSFACHTKALLRLRFAVVAALAFSMPPAALAQAPANSGVVTFIHMNDLHAHLTPHLDVVSDGPPGEASGRTKIVERGGLARLATVVKRIRAENPHSILMNIGDTYHGGAEALFTNGNAIVDPVNALGVDVGVPGNWDFAYGPLVTRMRYTNLPITRFMRPMQRAASRIGSGPLGRMRDKRSQETRASDDERMLDMMMPFGEIKRPNFPNLAANVKLTFPPMQRGNTLLPATLTKTVGGVKVGMIGITSDIVPRMHKMLALGMDFLQGEQNYKNLINDHQRRLRAEGAQIVVVMSELGIQRDYRLAQIVEPGVDVFFSAHTHEAVFKPLTSQSGALVVEAGNDGYVGRMDVRVVNGRVVDRRWDLLPLDRSVPDDARMKSLVDRARAPFLAKNANFSIPMPMLQQRLTQPLNTVIGHTAVTLDRRNVLESRFNDVMGEILRQYSGADIAMTPGFRFDSVVPAKGIETEDNTHISGAITLEDVYRFFPVPYTISTAEIDKARFREVMEEALTNVFSPDVFRQSGGWLEGFSGVDASIKLTAPDGNRVGSVRVGKSGSPFERSQVKVVGCSRFLDPPGSLCSYSGFSNVRPLINPVTGQAWTPVDLFVHAVAKETPATPAQNLRDMSGIPQWPRAPFIQPLNGTGRR